MNLPPPSSALNLIGSDSSAIRLYRAPRPTERLSGKRDSEEALLEWISYLCTRHNDTRSGGLRADQATNFRLRQLFRRHRAVVVRSVFIRKEDSADCRYDC